MATNNPGNLSDAPNQQVRAALITRIRSLLATNAWTQQEAARLCGQTQPRISDLRRGATERFSLDALVNIAAALARHSSTTEGGNMEYTEADGQRLVATESSTTERGGMPIATSGLHTAGGRIALVADIVRYADGS